VAISGMLAGVLDFSLLSTGLIILLVYHALSFITFGLMLKNAGPGYVVFIILNFITTYSLLQLAELYFI
jgi:hypothetical protein